MKDILVLAIPLLGLSIPLVALTGHYVIQPLVKVLSRLIEQQDHLLAPQQTQQQLAEVQARLERMERIVSRVVEEQQFQRALQEGSPPVESGSEASGPRLPA